ncbi:MAG: hypothetical protein GY861_17990 [bacterium]|nr:hypothetical protein [bacterium]
MSWLDVSTYLINNLGLALFLLCMFMLLSFFTWAFEYERTSDKNLANRTLQITVPISFFIFFAALLPSHDRILAVKIARIKNEAVNKENVTKGVETLERIGKKLECKYLGCDDED